ncbi:MAG: acyl-CoA dehydrogenase, partial [Deltaproteobacteria bacterium]|nr:acyl-CoA dehydrogenase [Deltaproteobacteria bacterium]
IFIVMALTDAKLKARGGITAFVVEKGAPGLSIGNHHHTMGMRGSQKSEVIFTDTPVPEENIIGPVGGGFTIALNTIDDGRLGIAAGSVGMADKLFELCAEYAQNTVYNSKPLSTRQAIQWHLADMATEIYAGRTMLYTTAARLDKGDVLPMEVAMCKMFCSEMVNRNVERALEIFGSEGYAGKSQVERICRDARIFKIYEGTAEIHRIIISRSLLRGNRPF